MKKYLLTLLLSLCSLYGHAQVYIPMPADSGATWRYRIYDIDYITHIVDVIMFLNGEDTMAYGNVYHKIISRSASYVVPSGFDPPVVPIGASNPDTYYGAIRESGKKVYQLNNSGEALIFDFNALVGDPVPAYSGTDQVTDIDSVLVSGTYHKRYLTTDPGYYIIEGIGSNRGLIPDINDGSGDVVFYCFTNAGVSWSPDTTIPCTYIYPIGYTSGIAMNKVPEIEVYPVPANDIVHITGLGQNTKSPATVFNSLGQTVWSGSPDSQVDIPVSGWPKGIYTLRINLDTADILIKKIVVE